MSTVAPFSPASLLVFHILFHVALALNSAFVRRVSFAPLAAILIYLLLNTSTEHLTQNWLTGHMLVIELLTASDYLLVTDAHEELRQSSSVASISAAPFPERLQWALKLTLNPRGIGWLHEPTAALPPKPTASRPSFLITQALHLAFYIALLLVVGRATSSIPTLHKGSPGLGMLVSGGVFFDCFLSVWVCGILTTARIFSTPGSMHILSGNSEESFGTKFFALLLSHAKLVAHRVMGLRPGSTMSAYAVVITLEDIAIATGKKLGLNSRVWKAAGYVWVLTWLTLSVPIWMDKQIAAGFMDMKSKGGMTLKFAALGDLYIDM
ncbi:Acetyltransferase sirH [Mycena venus]|uniref:Acetyltransferase sirH n=1 Tax=Mycena venus TaxID=2733690 RepID=A0A8H6Y8X4_9AGAR|nr:Acetyltransferase sirH [Mycena venus]